eukprot:gene14038-5017_t
MVRGGLPLPHVSKNFRYSKPLKIPESEPNNPPHLCLNLRNLDYRSARVLRLEITIHGAGKNRVLAAIRTKLAQQVLHPIAKQDSGLSRSQSEPTFKLLEKTIRICKIRVLASAERGEIPGRRDSGEARFLGGEIPGWRDSGEARSQAGENPGRRDPGQTMIM